MNAEPVLLEREGAIARIVLNRPESGNAIDLQMAQGLVRAALQCDADLSIRCVVLTGAGRLFCVGGDIAAFGSTPDKASARLSELAGTLHMAIARLARMRKPLLVLVNGPAAGAGLSLAILGDIVLTVRAAHFTAAYTAIGLSPDGSLTWQLPRLVGLRRAQEMILTNRRVSAEEAERIGLVTRAVDDAALAKEGAAITAVWLQSATTALGAARALLAQSFETGLETQMEQEARAIAAAGRGHDGQEGVAAFLGKRKPNFRGE
jgi:2-(1,2-epoxy-1,2-dihydrophenyl)acetyl-CoA isomerase